MHCTDCLDQFAEALSSDLRGKSLRSGRRLQPFLCFPTPDKLQTIVLPKIFVPPGCEHSVKHDRGYLPGLIPCKSRVQGPTFLFVVCPPELFCELWRS